MKKILKSIANNLLGWIIVGMLVVLAIQRCSNSGSVPPTKIDTVKVITHYYHDSTVMSVPTIVKQVLPQPKQIPPQYIPDTNYPSLKRQYEALRDSFLTQNISVDSLKVDSGYVAVKDTTQFNKITGRQWDYHIRSTVETVTITIPPKPKTQVYIGGGVLGNQNKPVSGLEAGGLLKNKRDQIYGIKVQKNFGQPIIYGANSYWKLKFHK